MRHDIQPNERSFSTKEVAEIVGIAAPTVRKYGQVLERHGYEFFKDRDRRIFVQSDIDALVAVRDTDKALSEIADDLVAKQKKRLEGSGTADTTDIQVADTYDNLPQDPAQLMETLTFLAKELAAARESNQQLTEGMSQLKTSVSRLQQDHHAISSAIGNSAQKTHSKIEKLTEQQRDNYETLLEQEKEKSDRLQKELRAMREKHEKEWKSQKEFNTRLEASMHRRQKSILGRLFSVFAK